MIAHAQSGGAAQATAAEAWKTTHPVRAYAVLQLNVTPDILQ